MSGIFGTEYSGAYDSLYKTKDYRRECNLIESLIKTHSKIPVHSILDLGCGTGRHSLELASRGYDVTGIDLSEEMLAIARENRHGIKNIMYCDFLQSDICTFRSNRKYDAVIMMFAVLGYQTGNERLLAALKTVRDHLKTGGVFICDVWYGPGVLAQKPSDRVAIVKDGDAKTIRISTGTLDSFSNTVEVNYHLFNIVQDTIESETKETHTMRYFFPKELELAFGISGMKVLEIKTFPWWKDYVKELDWNIGVVGR